MFTEETEFYRKLIKWKNESNGLALIVLGPRFSGKTTIIKKFGDKEFKKVVYINLEEMTEINELFAKKTSYEQLLDKTMNLLNFFENNVKDTLFVVEEIQACPVIVPLMENLYKEMPPFHLIITSSNPGHFINQDISGFKDRIQIIEIGPSSFEEFIQMTNHDLYIEYKKINNNNNIDKILNSQLNRELAKYLMTGGYPEIIHTYKTTKNTNKVNERLKLLSLNISNDFILSAPARMIKRISSIWNSIPEQAKSINRKFSFTRLNVDARPREYKQPLQWLIGSKTINKFSKINEIGLPLSQQFSEVNFRLLPNDIGLMKHFLKINDHDIIENNEYQNKKIFLETFVCQQLFNRFSNKQIGYYKFNRFSIDFVIEYKDLIIPVIVKSTKFNSSNNELKNYLRKFKSSNFGIVFSFSYLKIENNIITIPFYLANKTKQIIDEYLSELK